MGFNRIEAKVAAKTSMRLTRPSVVLVTLVYFLLTTMLARVISYLIYNPVLDVLVHIYRWNYGVEEVLEYVIRTHLDGIIIYFAIGLVLRIYSSVMSFGYTSYALRLARSEQPSYINLFDGFAKLGRVLWMSFLIWLFTTLWSVLVMAPAILLAAAISFLDWNADIFISVYTLLTIGGGVAIMAITYRYRLAPYFLIDDPACTARESIRRSKSAMQGWKMELFTLDWSFIGWRLLSVLCTYSVLNVWLLPYQCATEANFYDCVTAVPTTGGYVGPDYDYSSPDDPQNF